MRLPVCFACMLSLITMPAAYGVQTRHASTPPSKAFARELAAAKREGFPVSPKDLQAPLPPPDQNAAPLYTQLAQLLKTKPLRQEDTAPDYAGGYSLLPPERMEQIRRALADRRDIVDLIHQAASRPKCVFVIDWSKGPAEVASTEFPKEAMLREVARWLLAESTLQLYDKKPLEAVQTQALGFRVARHAASTPTLVAYLVAVAVDAIALAGMRRILYVAGDDPKVAEAVRQAIEKDRTPINLGYALRGELAEMLLFNKQNAEGVLFLHTMRKQIQAAERPYPEAITALKAIDAQSRHKQHTDPMYSIVEATSPVYEQAIVKSAYSEATAATVRCGAALLAWKAQHGAFPQTPAEAISPVPVDPFTGKPLSYRREGEGFVVYSVGESGKFNGGNTTQAPPRTVALFRYPLPVYARKPASTPFPPGMPPGMNAPVDQPRSKPHKEEE